MQSRFTIEIIHTEGIYGAHYMCAFHTILKKNVARKGIKMVLGLKNME